MMVGARTPVPDRCAAPDETEQRREVAPSDDQLLDAANAGATRDLPVREAISAAERREREARWACEWWPPE